MSTHLLPLHTECDAEGWQTFHSWLWKKIYLQLLTIYVFPKEKILKGVFFFFSSHRWNRHKKCLSHEISCGNWKTINQRLFPQVFLNIFLMDFNFVCCHRWVLRFEIGGERKWSWKISGWKWTKRGIKGSKVLGGFTATSFCGYLILLLSFFMRII